MPLAVAAHPGLTIPVAVVLALFLLWYWMRLGGENVPASRRVIRRCSIVLMIVALAVLVAALSLLDPPIHRRGWVMAWTAVSFLMMLIIASALVDAINNLNLHREEKRQALTHAAAEIIVAMREARSRDAVEASPRKDELSGGEIQEEDANS